MSKNQLTQNLVSKIETTLNTELHLAGLYADIAKDIIDPALQTFIYSMAGDAYGHFRALAIILALTDSQNIQQTLNIGENRQPPKLLHKVLEKKNSTIQPYFFVNWGSRKMNKGGVVNDR